MDQVGVRELRQNASALLRRVQAGEIIQITEWGRPVAKLVPAKPMHILDQLIAEGRARPAEGDLLEGLKTHPPVKLPPGSPTASDILAELREDER
jgi:prevent-host-death family protein